MSVPENLLYTKEHEWINKNITIGISSKVSWDEFSLNF